MVDLQQQAPEIDRELNKQLDKLYAYAMNEEGGGRTRYPGMTYEDGIKNVVDWLQGSSDRPDLED